MQVASAKVWLQAAVDSGIGSEDSALGWVVGSVSCPQAHRPRSSTKVSKSAKIFFMVNSFPKSV
jgi:hypothetical protein